MEINVFDQTITINIDPTKKTGIMLSGGLDSAALLFLMLKDIHDRNLAVDLSVLNVPNVNDNAKLYSRQVVDYLENYYDTKINLMNIGDGTLPPRQLINQPASEMLNSGRIEMMYSGQNQFPPEASEWESYKKSVGRFQRRDPNLPDPVRGRFPFIKLYKHHILEIYRMFNILDLAKITHSCTRLTVGKCNECLWCDERSWAFSKLNLVDED